MINYFFIILFFSNTLLATEVNGVHEIFLLDKDKQIISKGTSFSVYSEKNDEVYVATSYHLLNTQLLIAESIVFKYNDSFHELSIINIDKLNDLMLLKPANRNLEIYDNLDLSLNQNDCENDLNIVGYINQRQVVVGADEMSGTEFNNLKKISVFLQAGFSGAPVFSEKTNVCGMVVLSSKNNASSIAIPSRSIKKLINKKYNSSFSIANYRKQENLENNVYDQSQLTKLIEQASGQQIIVNLAGNGYFKIQEADNIILNIRSNNIKKLTISDSQNILVSGMIGGKLLIKNSNSITVSNSFFYKHSYGIMLNNSKDLLLEENNFQELKVAILFKNMNYSAIKTVFSKKNNYDNVDKKTHLI